MTNNPMYGRPSGATTLAHTVSGGKYPIADKVKPYPWRTQAQVCGGIGKRYGPPPLPKLDKALSALINGTKPTAQTKTRAKRTPKPKGDAPMSDLPTKVTMASPFGGETHVIDSSETNGSTPAEPTGEEIATARATHNGAVAPKPKPIQVKEPDAPRTAKQVYAIAARALTALGYTFPTTKGEASELIQELDGLKVGE